MHITYYKQLIHKIGTRTYMEELGIYSTKIFDSYLFCDLNLPQNYWVCLLLEIVSIWVSKIIFISRINLAYLCIFNFQGLNSKHFPLLIPSLYSTKLFSLSPDKSLLGVLVVLEVLFNRSQLRSWSGIFLLTRFVIALFITL